MFKKLCIVGVGLIGGSIAIIARDRKLAKTIVGFGRPEDMENLNGAKSCGIIDECYTDIKAAVENADCIIIAVPVSNTESVLRLLQPFWSEEAVYFDVGSTKGDVVIAAKNVFNTVPSNFILAHPIAGGEKNGVPIHNPTSSDPSPVVDFKNKQLIITPQPTTNRDSLEKVKLFWTEIGSLVSVMSTEEHDRILAATSHLPHLVAFAFTNMLGHRDEKEPVFKFAAGGFRDFTRIASSDPTVWTAICEANKTELIPLLEQFKNELTQIQQLLENKNYDALFSLFRYANSARERFLTQKITNQ